MPAKPDLSEIQRALALLFQPGDCVELRCIGGRTTLNGFFQDQQKLAQAACQLSEAGENVFVCLNPIRPELYPRSADAICRTAKGGAASDSDIRLRRWLLIDIDATRPKGTSATDQQLAAAEGLARQTYSHLQRLGLPTPPVVLSGNGYHLYLPLANLPNDERCRWACERFLALLAEQCQADGAHIDAAMFNAARIATLPGTAKRKGSDLPTHPHRLARIVSCPDPLERIGLDQLLALVGQPPTLGLTQPAPAGEGSNWDIQQLLEQRGLQYERDQQLQTATGETATRYVLEACPFEPEHQRSAVLLQFPSGAVAFRCLGNRCAGKTWQDLKQAWGLPAAGGITAADIVLPLQPAQLQSVQLPTALELPSYIHPPETPQGAFYGPLGQLVLSYAPHTEASPTAMLACLLTYFGNALGRRYFVELDGRQFPKLFCCLIGRTAKGRKFTADQNACRMIDAISPLAELCRHTGLSTGEGLIKTLLDAKDGLLLRPAVFQEGEFGNVIKRKERQGNSLDGILRDAWDDTALGTTTRTDPLRAVGSHVSLVVHITPDELKRLLSCCDLTSGFANRFLWIHSQRSQRKPDARGFRVDMASKQIAAMQQTFEQLTTPLLDQAQEIPLTGQAQAAWNGIYQQLDGADDQDDGGLLEDLCARLPAYVRRLALIYCLADGQQAITPAHLQAGLALVEYSRATLDYVYSLVSWAEHGNQQELIRQRAAKFLQAVPTGQELTRTRVLREVYQRNRTAKELNQIRDYLARCGQLQLRQQEGIEYWQRTG